MNHIVLPAVTFAAVLTIPAGQVAGSGSHVLELVAGSCTEQGALIASLAEVRSDGDGGEPPPAMAAVIEALGPNVMRGQGIVSADFVSIVAADHAVRVRDASSDETVACGDFGGIEESVTDLHVGLAGAGMSGVAWLHDAGDGRIEAAMALAPTGAVAGHATGGAHVEVVISRSRYAPDTLEIEAGATVTWINQDAVPHTTTATTPEVHFDSGYMALDDAYAFTFVEPGEYPYFCTFHPRMRAVVIVK